MTKNEGKRGVGGVHLSGETSLSGVQTDCVARGNDVAFGVGGSVNRRTSARQLEEFHLGCPNHASFWGNLEPPPLGTWLQRTRQMDMVSVHLGAKMAPSPA